MTTTKPDPLNALHDLIATIAFDIDEHWSDDDLRERSDLGLTLFNAIVALQENGVDPPLVALATIGRFQWANSD